MSLRILGRPSSINVRKVLWTIEEIGAPYLHEPHWGTPDAILAELFALNPNVLVPVIVDENGPLWESNTICRYLATKHGRANLLPSDAAGRAQVEKWMDWQASELNPAWRYAFMALVREDPASCEPAEIARSAAAWNRKMTLLNLALADRTFIAGEAFTLADIVLGLSAHRWRSTPIAHAPLDNVARWMRTLEDRPPFLRCTAPPFD